MELRTSLEADDILVIEPSFSSLDADNVKDFRAAMDALLTSKNRIVLDMRSIDFVDSSGLGALISCQRIMNSRNGVLRLSSMSVAVGALFELMRMQRVFIIHSRRSDAIGAFRTTV